MKKMSLLSVSLLALLLLSACKSTEKESKQDSSSSQTSQISTSQTDSTDAYVETNSSNETSNQEVPSASLDLQAIANQDFSSIAGSYEASGGNYIINTDGSFTYSKSDGDLTFPITDGKVENGMAVLSSNNFTFYVIPAGVDSPVSVPDFLGTDDNTRDRVIIDGEGMNLFFLN